MPKVSVSIVLLVTLLVSCSATSTRRGRIKPLEVFHNLVVRKGIPLIDLSGHGWQSLADYAMDPSPPDDVVLYKVSLFEVWVPRALRTSPQADDVTDKLRLRTVQYYARSVYTVRYVPPGTPEYEQRIAEKSREFERLSVKVNGVSVPLSTAFVVHGSSVVAFFTVRNGLHTIEVADEKHTRILELPPVEKCKAVEVDGRRIFCIARLLWLIEGNARMSFVHDSVGIYGESNIFDLYVH